MGGGQSQALIQAENNLLRAGREWYKGWREAHMTPTPGSATDISYSVSDVPIGKERTIHTLEYVSNERKGGDGVPLVCMHGYGTGSGMYYAALPALAERWQGKVYAIDSLGSALSSRPSWTLGHGQSCPVSDAEAFFLDGLEQWREAMELDKMVLCGHSLGGYLAVAYAEKYPARVERLVLVSAVGTPEAPPELADVHAKAPWIARTVLSAWQSGWSPFSIAKLGFGNAMLGRYVNMRFSDASWVQKPELQAYLVGSWCGGANSAGGYAHATLLKPGGVGELAYAREPTGPVRIPSLQIGRISAIYGDRDWMDWRNMAKVRKAIKDRQTRTGKGDGPEIEILHVADANHNVQVDNPLGFVDAVMATCRGHDTDGKVFGRRYYTEDRPSNMI